MINYKRIGLLIAILVLIAGFVVTGAWSARVYSDVKQLRALVDEVRELQSQGAQMDNIPEAIDLAERISFVIDDLKEEVEPILPLIQIIGCMEFDNRIIFIYITYCLGQFLCLFGHTYIQTKLLIIVNKILVLTWSLSLI